MYLTKLRKRAKAFGIAGVLVIVALLGYEIFKLLSQTWSLRDELAMRGSALTASWLLQLPLYVLVLLIVGNVFWMLLSISAKDSPFTVANARRLGWTGGLLLAYEPVAYLLQWIGNRWFPLQIGENLWMTSNQSYSGIFIVCGLGVLAVSMVFRYGVELQRQSDETL